MHQGILSGIFQMETSGSAKELITKILPINIEEISDISALNRPGPLQNGFDTEYIENRSNGFAPKGLHPKVAKILESTYWTIVYQEQVNNIAVLASNS